MFTHRGHFLTVLDFLKPKMLTNYGITVQYPNRTEQVQRTWWPAYWFIHYLNFLNFTSFKSTFTSSSMFDRWNSHLGANNTLYRHVCLAWSVRTVLLTDHHVATHHWQSLRNFQFTDEITDGTANCVWMRTQPCKVWFVGFHAAPVLHIIAKFCLF